MAAKAPPPRKHRSGAEKRKAAAQRKAPRTKDGRSSAPPKVTAAAVPPTAPRPAPPSGAQKRQDARAREQEARVANAHAAQLGQLPSIQDFDRLPPPPIGDPVQAIAWANDLVLLNLYQVVRHPGLEPQDRWRYVKELTAVLGLVRDKAHTQAQVKKLRTQQQQEPGDQGDLQTIVAGQFSEGWTPPASEPGGSPTPGPPPNEDQRGGGQPEPPAAAPEAGGGGAAPAR